jgi:hypothetical protein
MAYEATATITITITQKQAFDIMQAMGRMSVDQIAETYVALKKALADGGYVPPVMSPPPPPMMPTPMPPVVPNPVTAPIIPPPTPSPTQTPAPHKA